MVGLKRTKIDRSGQMKKVLIIAYDFPPYTSAGGFRPYSWFKYMYEFEIYPVVVTRQWANKYGNHLDYIAPSDSSQAVIEETDQGIRINAPYFPSFSNNLLLKHGNTKHKLLRKITSTYIEILQFFLWSGLNLNCIWQPTTT